jgi:hypothetical protein
MEETRLARIAAAAGPDQTKAKNLRVGLWVLQRKAALAQRAGRSFDLDAEFNRMVGDGRA